MKDIQFHLEYDSSGDKRKNNHNGNVVAIIVGNGTFKSGDQWCYEAIGAVYFVPDSPVASTAISLEVMRERTKRINEKRAREIHPELFRYLEQ